MIQELSAVELAEVNRFGIHDLNAADFDEKYKFKMVEAYPDISGVRNPYYAAPEVIEEGFALILKNRNLRETHEMYLATLGGN